MKGYRELVDFQFPSFSNLSLNRVSAETSLFQLIYLNFKQASDAGYLDRTFKQVYLMGIGLKVKKQNVI